MIEWVLQHFMQTDSLELFQRSTRDLLGGPRRSPEVPGGARRSIWICSEVPDSPRRLPGGDDAMIAHKSKNGNKLINAVQIEQVLSKVFSWGPTRQFLVPSVLS
jgi:hypothetical protein